MMVLSAAKLAEALRMMNKGVKSVLLPKTDKKDGPTDLTEAANIYAQCINGVNSLDQYEIIYNNRDISEYRIPKSLLQFVYPRSIKFDVSKIRYKDLLIRPKHPTMVINLSELEYANNVYAKNLKETKVETVPITDARIDRNLADMIDSIQIKDKALYSVEDQFLYPVIDEVASVIGEGEFSKDVAEVEELFYKTFARKNS